MKTPEGTFSLTLRHIWAMNWPLKLQGRFLNEVESAIRRVINLRVKGSGMFWKKENAEKIIFLRSLVLTGKIKNACRKATSIVKKMFDNNELKDMPMPS